MCRRPVAEREELVPGFAILHETIGSDIDLLKVSGFLDAHTFEQVEGAIAALFSQGRYRLIVDLTDLDYISSAGAGVLLAVSSESAENGGELVLLKPKERVMEVLDLLGVAGMLPVANDRDEAMAALRS
jgi:anti-sigma B factor antagonist